SDLILFLLVLSYFNWILEILKWQDLVSVFKKISFKMALQQSLGSLTASLFTPNRIGEYGAKAIFYTSEFRRRIVLLNFLGNSMQMLVTTVFGLLGLYFFMTTYSIDINDTNTAEFAAVLLFSLSLVFLGGKQKSVTIKGVSIEKVWQFLKKIPLKHYRVCLMLPIFMYLIFSFQC